MKRWLPFPLLSAVLAAGWLALVGEASIAHLLLGGLLALAIPLVAAPFLDHLQHVVAPGAAVRLLFLLIRDIVLANIAVARLVLGPEARLRPAFVSVPLALSHPQSIALLASIITMTPGTVSADLAPDRRTLLVHALDCADPARLVADIKRRYEQPLLEIFGC
ncbi:MAG: Na+/H+ antiporter subunit E [Burkholderiales bacterium]|nr:Na+/H+ antiporter subunit E [Burkholderiales bacterium]